MKFSDNAYVLEHCPPNPTMEYAMSMKYVIPPECDQLISRGGGSTIDVGKWLAKELNLEHIAIPTTAGTGSEVTKYVVLTVGGKKTTFTDDAYIPKGYILDPDLVTSLQVIHTLSTGLDALSQALEAVWSRNGNAMSRDFGASAVALIMDNLEKCVSDPNDLQARMSMMIAANLSGRAINITKTNVCHAISYPLTDWYGIPHGLACAMTLGYFAKRILGVDVRAFIKRLKLPTYKIDKGQVARFVMGSEKLKDCPIPITENDIIEALNESTA